MKRTLIPSLLLACFTRCYAIFGLGDVVYDPIVDANIISMNASQLAQWATAIKKYEDQILNQLENINRLKQLGNIQNVIAARVGDWQGVYDRAKSIQLTADKLTDLSDILNYDNAVYFDTTSDLTSYNDRGNFATLDITTVRGRPAVTVNEGRFRRYKTVENLYDTATETLDKTSERRDDILKEIAKTAEDIAAAPTQAEADKLQAKLAGLQIALQQLQSERNEVMQRMLTQRALNENQKDKEAEIRALLDHENAVETFQELSESEFGGAYFRKQ